MQIPTLFYLICIVRVEESEVILPSSKIILHPSSSPQQLNEQKIMIQPSQSHVVFGFTFVLLVVFSSSMCQTSKKINSISKRHVSSSNYHESVKK